MKVKNVSDSFLFPAANLVGDDPQTVVRLADESDDDFAKRGGEVRKRCAAISMVKQSNLTAEKEGRPVEALPENVEELQKLLNPERVARCKQLGVDLPSDMVRATMTLGSLVFDLFSATSVPPTAPLAAALFSKRAQNLAVKLQKDEFELDDEFLAAVRPALEDEEVWKKINLTLYTMVKDKKHYLQVNCNAAGFFGNVMNAAIAVFIPEATTDGAETPAD